MYVIIKDFFTRSVVVKISSFGIRIVVLVSCILKECQLLAALTSILSRIDIQTIPSLDAQIRFH